MNAMPISAELRYRNDSTRGATNAFHLRLNRLLPVHLTDFDIAEKTSEL